MGVLSRYTEDELEYDFDEFLIVQLREIPYIIAKDISNQIDAYALSLPKKFGWTQRVAGVSNADKDAYFFVLDYLYQPNDIPVFLEIEQVESDTYLDYKLENKSLK